MKQLILMRHGKSSWQNDLLDDYDRPLKKRGKRDAPVMAQLLADNEIIPEMILSSSAARTRQTTQLVNDVLNLQEDSIRYFDNFYLADQKELIKELKKLSNSIDTVMIIGHNPTMEFFTANLTGEIHRFPTAAIAHIDLAISTWAELKATKSCGILLNLWRPKELRD